MQGIIWKGSQTLYYIYNFAGFRKVVVKKHMIYKKNGPNITHIDLMVLVDIHNYNSNHI